MLIICSFSFVVFAGVFLLKTCIEEIKSVDATKAWCDASEIFMGWRLRNQGVYIGLSDEGKKLLSRLIDAYDLFLDTHKYINDDGHRDYLVSLFNDFPPNSPNEIKSKEKRGALKSPSFIFLNFKLRYN